MTGCRARVSSMRNKVIFIVCGCRAAAGAGQRLYLQPTAQGAAAGVQSGAPTRTPTASTPNGIIESTQAQGENINIYPEVAGPITQVLVAEGAAGAQGRCAADDRRFGAAGDRRAAAGRRRKRRWRCSRSSRPSRAARVSQCRAAQVENAQATLKNAEDQLAKQQHSYDDGRRNRSARTRSTTPGTPRGSPPPISRSSSGNTSSPRPEPGSTTSRTRKAATWPCQKAYAVLGGAAGQVHDSRAR